LEDLVLERFLAQQAFELTNLALEFSHFRRRDDLVVSADGLLAPFGHQSPIFEYEAGMNTILAGNVRDRHPGRSGFFNGAEFLMQGPAALMQSLEAREVETMVRILSFIK
jgi:hypothetical protein